MNNFLEIDYATVSLLVSRDSDYTRPRLAVERGLLPFIKSYQPVRHSACRVQRVSATTLPYHTCISDIITFGIVS